MPVKVKLTKSNVEALKAPAAGQALIWDTEVSGFGLRITAGDVRSFILQRRIDGRDRRMKLGRFGDITCDEARKLAQKAVGKIAAGGNPIAEREAAQADAIARHAASVAAQRNTVRALVLHYIDHLKASGRSSADSVRRQLEKYVLESPIASRPATEVTSKEWAALLRAISQSGKKRTGGQIRAYLHAAFNLALSAELSPDTQAGLLAFNLASNPITLISSDGGLSGNRTRNLSPAELKAFLEPLAACTDVLDRALLLCLLCGGQRPAQLLRAKLADVDLSAGTVLIFDPKGSRKQPRAHLVPVGARGLLILKAQVTAARALGNKFLFTLTGKHSLTSSQLYWRLDEIRSGMVAADKAPGGWFQMRDIRRTVETMLAGLGVSKEIRAQLLSHGIGGVQDRHYDMHDYLNEKRAAVVALERRIGQIERGELENPKVIRLQPRRSGQ